MLLVVTDGQGNAQTIVVKGQEVVVDYSGTIAISGVSQLLLAASSARSGWIMQNNGSSPMTINEIGNDATIKSFAVAPFGGVFPPENFPLTVNQLNIAGIAGDNFILRAW